MTPPPLRWLLIATHVPNDGSGGGMTRYAVELSRALSRFAGVDLSVLVKPSARAYWQAEVGLHPSRVLGAPVDWTMVSSGLEYTGVGIPALRSGFDVVHGTKHLLPLRSSALRVLTVHDMLLVERPTDFAASKRHLLKAPYLRSIRGADLLVCDSGATQRAVAPYQANARQEVAMVPLAVAPGLVSAEPVPIEGLVLDQAALAVTDFGPRKNAAKLLAWWPEVVQRRPGATLVLVGRRPAPGLSVTDDLAAAERTGRVVHLGPVTDAQLRWLYDRVQVTLCPSEAEGFGLPVMEALTFGCPALTSTDPAMREASAGRAVAVPTWDGPGWVAAICEALAADRSILGGALAVRSWEEVADATHDAVRDALAAVRAAA